MNGYVRVFVDIEQLENFILGKEGYGYTYKYDKVTHWNTEIFVPIERIKTLDEKKNQTPPEHKISWKWV